MEASDPEHVRREAVGAFVHQLRTPLTSMRMVVEIGRRASNGSGVVLDEELVGMLEGALSDLQGLADALQETSRIERGKLVPMPMSCSLAGILAEIRGDLAPDAELRVELSGDVECSWDVPRMTSALRGVAQAVIRCGNGSATVDCSVSVDAENCALRFRSGEPGGDPKPLNGDFGYPFFRGYTFLSAVGGTVEVDRSERHCEVVVRVPLGT